MVLRPYWRKPKKSTNLLWFARAMTRNFYSQAMNTELFTPTTIDMVVRLYAPAPPSPAVTDQLQFHRNFTFSDIIKIVQYSHRMKDHRTLAYTCIYATVKLYDKKRSTTNLVG
jgi:hypothetical protein